MKRAYISILAVLLTAAADAQETEAPKKFGINFSGFVKSDFFYDTRQTVAVREGHFLLWPEPELIDAAGSDINATPNLNLLAVQSRLHGSITGPDAFGARTSGVIEGDFFAQANDNINLFRLRHAYLKLSWTSTEVLFGQFWNPLFITACYPGTISFNTGTPLQSFARNPQLRVTHKFGSFSATAAVLSQRDFASRGDAGPTSTYLRNAAIPDMHIQLHYEKQGKESNNKLMAGVAMAYKMIAPRLYSEVTLSPAREEIVLNPTDSSLQIIRTNAVKAKYKVNERVGGLTLMAFGKLVMKPLTLKAQARYGENIADLLSVSGFAVKNVKDPITGELEYTPLKNITFWGEIHTNGKRFQTGIFGGYLKNLGTRESMSDAGNTVYGLAQNIAGLWRLSPRVTWTAGKLTLALEFEYTVADYGSGYDVNYIPAETKRVANLRTLLSGIYNF